jgi:hypothetical protein
LDIIALIVSNIFINIINFILVSNGLSIKAFNQKNIDLKNKNKEMQNGNKNEEEKTLGTVFIPTPIFFNPMIKQTKGYYGKYQKKKTRPFTEREGDWICKNCKNLNFAFRLFCNRCHLDKEKSEKINKFNNIIFNNNNNIINNNNNNNNINNNNNTDSLNQSKNIIDYKKQLFYNI